MLPVDRANLSSAQGFLSVIQSSTNMAYHRIMGVLGQSFRPALCGISLPQHDDIRHSTSSFDTAIEASSEEITAVDAASLRRQILKLNRRLQHLEEENKKRAKRETVMYCSLLAAKHLVLVASLEVASALKSNVLSARNIELATLFLVSVFAF